MVVHDIPDSKPSARACAGKTMMWWMYAGREMGAVEVAGCRTPREDACEKVVVYATSRTKV